jgi:D-serine deaminase-like pyridoxal phosphate-dependent protein
MPTIQFPMATNTQYWYQLDNAEEIASPALIVYPDRIEENIRRMVSIAGDPARLRPHVKTHKMSKVTHLQIKHGIRKFKCATIAEAEMLAQCYAKDILLAMQPVGPAMARLFLLLKTYPGSIFSCIADSEKIIRELSATALKESKEIRVWLDINAGMNRTGIPAGKEALALYKLIDTLPGIRAMGLHVYDGHIRETDFALRKKICDEGFKASMDLARDIENSDLPKPHLIVGGTPTFTIHALREGVELSPGTLTLWDYGYSKSFPDLDFQQPALILTRVVSKPARGLLCLDCGTKSMASEMPQPRIHLMGLENYEVKGHNEEHFVIETREADSCQIGDIFYGVPVHICPTVARYDQAYAAKDNHYHELWRIEAQNRKINI